MNVSHDFEVLSYDKYFDVVPNLVLPSKSEEGPETTGGIK
jgi:hypothetical protein